MRYIVKVEELSAEVLENLKKNSRIIGILDVHNRGFYGDGVWIGVIDSGIDLSDPLVSGSIVLERDFTSASAALLLSADEDRGKVIRSIFSTAEDKGFPRWIQGHGLIRTDKALEVTLCD